MKLDKYIKENRKAFDNEMPSDRLWDEIAQHLPVRERRIRPLWITMSVAASVSVLVVSGILFAYQMGQKDGHNYAMETMEVQQYYENRLQTEMGKLAGLNVRSEDLAELASFDTTIVNQRPMNEKEKEAQLKAIIQNFETRISIIEKLLEKTNENQGQQKTSKDEKSI